MSMRDVSAIRRKTPAEIGVPEGGVRVLESHHLPQFEMDFGTWPFHKICWVAIGRGRLESMQNSSVIRRNDFLVLPSDWRHRFVDEPKAPLTLVILCVSAHFIAGSNSGERGDLWRTSLERYPDGRPLEARTAFHQASLIEIFRRALREQDNRAPGWETVLQMAADELLIRLARGFVKIRTRGKQSGEQSIRGAVEYIDAHPYAALQIDAMAERCGLSSRRFTDLFKKHTGETFNQYANRRRILYACERLRETSHILYACHESGFNDPAYFYRVFKKQMGVTPGQFLERIRRGREQTRN